MSITISFPISVSCDKCGTTLDFAFETDLATVDMKTKNLMSNKSLKRIYTEVRTEVANDGWLANDSYCLCPECAQSGESVALPEHNVSAKSLLDQARLVHAMRKKNKS